MGLAKQYWQESLEEDYLEEKAAWIRAQMDDPSADEATDGWDELSEEYDRFHADRAEDYEDEWSVRGKSRFAIFEESMSAAREILGTRSTLGPASTRNLLVMMHAHVIGTLEAYLSSTFIEKALSSEAFMRRLVENDPKFAKQQFTVAEIFTKRESLKNDLSQYLKSLIFHDIAKVSKLYASVLEIDFGKIDWLFRAVKLRHDCVHRAGYDKDGAEVVLTAASVEELIEKCEDLVAETESLLMSLPDDGDFFWNED